MVALRSTRPAAARGPGSGVALGAPGPKSQAAGGKVPPYVGKEGRLISSHVLAAGGRNHYPEDQAAAIRGPSVPRPAAYGAEGPEGFPALW